VAVDGGLGTTREKEEGQSQWDCKTGSNT